MPRDDGFGTLIMIVANILIWGWILIECLSVSNPCITSSPKRVVSGSISHSFGTPNYLLDYAGARELTGDVCQVQITVSEGEYERHMYED